MSRDITNNHRAQRRHRKHKEYMQKLPSNICKQTRKAMLSERDAKAHAGTRKNKLHNISAYECRACGRWHVGHGKDAARESQWYPDTGRIVIRRFSDE